MPDSIEEIYISSAKKLRTSLPKFVIFIGIAYLIWLIGTTFFIPLSKGVFIGAVEAVRLDSLVMLIAVLVLIIASFVEIKNVSDACAGIVTSFIVRRGSKIEEVRFRQLKRSFRNIGYIIPFAISSLIFSSLLDQIHPLLNTVIVVAIGVWIVIASVLLAMVLGLEIEESARLFTERIERLRRVDLRKRLKIRKK